MPGRWVSVGQEAAKHDPCPSQGTRRMEPTNRKDGLIMGWTQTYNAGPTREHIIRDQEGDPRACGTCGYHAGTHPRVTGSEWANATDLPEPHDFTPRTPMYRVLDYAATLTVAWMAVECLTDFPYGKGKVFCAITLFRRSRDGSITTKEVSESMGVDEFACPARILDQLSPVDELYGPILSKQVCDNHHDCSWSKNEGMYVDRKEHVNQRSVPDGSAAWATAWREGVRAYHAERAAKPKVKAGNIVRFTKPIEFSNGDSLTDFEFVKGSTFRAGYTRYRITRWRDSAYSVIA